MNMPAHYRTLELSKVESLFRQYRSEAGRPLKVLDYGCGRGTYLRQFQAIGHELIGCDFNPDYVAEARAAGFDAYGPDELFSGDHRFDVIYLSHLVEHLPPADLVGLVPRLCALLAPAGRLIIITPMLGERFFHDSTHVRPYYPQSIRHAFGQTQTEVMFGAASLIELKDIYFFKDPYKTRTWRSFYVRKGLVGRFTAALNDAFDVAWRLSGGRIGVTTSWLGVYVRTAPPA
jgi:SAM-dependent methyltransferase